MSGIIGFVALVSAVGRCDTGWMRLFEFYSPGVVLVCIIAGVGTYMGGVAFAIPFVVGVAALALADYLDNYGLESED